MLFKTAIAAGTAWWNDEDVSDVLDSEWEYAKNNPFSVLGRTVVDGVLLGSGASVLAVGVRATLIAADVALSLPDETPDEKNKSTANKDIDDVSQKAAFEKLKKHGHDTSSTFLFGLLKTEIERKELIALINETHPDDLDRVLKDFINNLNK